MATSPPPSAGRGGPPRGAPLPQPIEPATRHARLGDADRPFRQAGGGHRRGPAAVRPHLGHAPSPEPAGKVAPLATLTLAGAPITPLAPCFKASPIWRGRRGRGRSPRPATCWRA